MTVAEYEILKTINLKNIKINQILFESKHIDGTFKVNEDLTGASSGAVQRIRLIDYTNFDEGYGENDEFELQADAIIDFSEGNPFGQP